MRHADGNEGAGTLDALGEPDEEPVRLDELGSRFSHQHRSPRCPVGARQWLVHTSAELGGHLAKRSRDPGYAATNGNARDGSAPQRASAQWSWPKWSARSQQSSHIGLVRRDSNEPEAPHESEAGYTPGLSLGHAPQMKIDGVPLSEEHLSASVSRYSVVATCAPNAQAGAMPAKSASYPKLDE